MPPIFPPETFYVKTKFQWNSGNFKGILLSATCHFFLYREDVLCGCVAVFQTFML